MLNETGESLTGFTDMDAELNSEKKNSPKKFRESVFLHTRFDTFFFLGIVMLSIFGLIMIYSASYFFAQTHLNEGPAYFFNNQLQYVGIGILLLIAVSFVRPAFWRKFWVIALVASFILVFVVRFTPLGKASHGAYRWLKLGPFSLQVAEPIKLCVIIGLSGLFVNYRFNALKAQIFLLAGFGLLAFFIYLFTNNLSTAFIIFMMVYISCIIVIPKNKLLIAGLIAIFVLAVIAVLIIKFTPYSEGSGFRITRIRAWLDPTNPLYAANEAYQPTQALYAIASGGFFGKGLGQSLIKFKLPEPHNDYILSIIFEELGVLGALFLTALFGYVLYKTFRVFKNTKEPFLKFMVLGVFLQLALQITLNYAVTLGIFPTTGVTLPFISAGGASVVFFFVEFGIVFAVDRQNAEDQLYRDTMNQMETDDPYLKQLRQEKGSRKERHE